jgi:glycosyltransferase involved in cell wall biosynthesis
MKVLHLTEGLTDGDGGAIALHRLHCGLKEAGVHSKILCTTKWPSGASDDIIKVQSSRMLARAAAHLKNISGKIGLSGMLDPTHFDAVKDKAFLDADLVTLHGIRGVCSPLAIPALTRSRPTVLVLHDMMSFTGHCFHSLDCERWKTGCGKCPYPNIPPSISMDNTRLAWKLRNWAFSRSDLEVVAPSSWMVDMAKQSMLRRFSIHQIPHGIDTDIYRPHEPELCRSVLNIPKRKKVLMFMAANLSGRLKGGDLFVKVVQSLPESLKAETVILLLGRRGEALASSLGVQTIHLGYVESDLLKVICYSAADCFVTTTRAESFGNVLAESLACGTPVVAQKVCGLADIVRPEVTGLLAEPEDIEGFRDHIIELLENTALRHAMRQQCRKIALEEYSLSVQAQRYIHVYRQLLNGSSEGARCDR